jgi:two-component system NtrC family response regulator
MATVLIVDDDPALREGLAEALTDLGHAVRTAASGREALAAVSRNTDAVLLDLRMPGGIDGIEVLRRIRARDDAPPVVVLTAYASPENTIEAMRLGAFDHLVKPIGREALSALIDRLPPRSLPAPALTTATPEGLIGTSEAMRRVQKQIGLAADAEATVLIRGETGTGKELVARALHIHSRRSHAPFVAVNCAAIPQELLESELFGHVKGSFTGANVDRAGAFRDAGNGTLFLDEIGDMPLPMQAKILRALQERVITPVGGKPAQVTWRSSLRPANSVRTSITGSMWCRSSSRHCATARTTSSRLQNTSCRSRRPAGRGRNLRAMRPRSSAIIRGRAMCASSGT